MQTYELYLQHSLLLFGLQGMNGLCEAIKRFIANTFGKLLGVIQARMHFCDSFQEVHAHDGA